MKVVYHTRPCFFDYALCLVRYLSQKVELHLIIELAPEDWNSTVFNIPRQNLDSGIHDAKPILSKYFGQSFNKYWKDCKSVKLAINNCPKSIHPQNLWNSYVVNRYIGRLNADIVHFDQISIRTSFFLFLLRRQHVLMTVHDPFPHSGEKNWRKNVARVLSFLAVNKFVLLSKQLKHDYSKEYNISDNQFIYSRLGIYDVYRQYQPQSDSERYKNNILFFGRLSPYKGIDTLCKAIGNVVKSHPEVRFVVAGSAVNTFEAPAILTDPDYRKNIIFLNHFISNELLAELFSNALIVVCPYIDATQSGVISTAFAFGKPVIATTTGGLPEYIINNDNGLLFEPRDDKTLAELLKLILSDQSRLDKLTKGVDKSVNGFLSWQTISSELVADYNRIIQEK